MPCLTTGDAGEEMNVSIFGLSRLLPIWTITRALFAGRVLKDVINKSILPIRIVYDCGDMHRLYSPFEGKI